MEELLPWAEFCAVIAPHYSKAGNGRPPIGLERILRMYLIANRFNLADEAYEDALYDVPAFRDFCQIDLGRERRSGLLHSASVTPANVHDSRELANLLHGNETRLYGDSAYTGQKDMLKQVAPKAKDFTNKRAVRNKPLTDADKETNRRKSQVRARISPTSRRPVIANFKTDYPFPP